MTPSADALSDCLPRFYDLVPLCAVRIERGTRTSNWAVTTESGPLFAKVYSSTADLDAETEAIHLSHFARERGLPGPTVHRTRGGSLLARAEEGGIALFDYVDDASLVPVLSDEQMRVAGEALGKLHRALASYPTIASGESSRWSWSSPNEKHAEIDHYLNVIRTKSQPDDFDQQTEPILERRLELLKAAWRLYSDLPPLHEQVIHGDYCPQNLLFRGAELAAIVDFGPPAPFPIAYEIGRMSLFPTSVVREGWIDRAVCFVSAYCAEYRVPEKDIVSAPGAWFIRLLRSTYGLREHYAHPQAAQPDLDAFWFQRAATADAILANLEGLESRFSEAWSHAMR